MNELMPCRHCGEKPMMMCPPTRKARKGFWVMCCYGWCDEGPETDAYDTKENAVRAWNRDHGCSDAPRSIGEGMSGMCSFQQP